MKKAKTRQEIVTEMQISKGLFELEELLINTMPCSPSMRYLVACWVISSFMKEALREKGLLQVVGSSGIGKSKLLERWSYLIYGEIFTGRATDAAYRHRAVKDPILFMDNIEKRDLLQSRRDFLIGLAMSEPKPMVSPGDSEDVTYQKLSSLGMISGIEPFPSSMSELINRTFTIKCESAFRQGLYINQDCLKAISDKRASILLSIEGLVKQKIKPALKEDRVHWLAKIKSIVPNTRLEDHLYMMVIIMEALSVYIPIRECSYILSPEQALDQWLSN